LIGFLFFSGRLHFGEILNSYQYPLFLISGILSCSLALATPIFRWWVLAKIQKLPLTGFDSLRLTMIGYFFNIFIPGGSGGDVVRAAYTVRDCKERRPQALTIAVMDRGLGLHALLLVNILVLAFQQPLLDSHPDLKPWLLVVGGMLILGTVAPLLLFSKRSNGIVIRLLGRFTGGPDAWNESLALYKSRPAMLFLAYAISIASAIFNVLAIHYMMLAVGSTPTVSESMVVVPLIIIANTLPITPGGIGMAESASAGLYAMIGQAGGANGMFLARLIIIIHALFGLPFFLINKRDAGFQK